MEEDVSLQLAEEEERQGLRIAAADGAGLHGAGEVAGQEAERPAGRDLLVVRVERHDHRRGVHLHGDGRAEDLAEERHEAAGELAHHLARIGLRVEVRQGQ